MILLIPTQEDAMIINSSQLSMDASTGHKDVSRTTNGKILSRNHAGRNTPHFNLKLPDLEQFQATRNQNSLTKIEQSHSSTINNSQNTQKSDNERLISRVVSEITGTTAKIRNFSNLFQETMPTIKPSFEGPSKRFYRIGGQQFSLNFSSTKVHYEYEYYNYNSKGTVNTADGRQIDFSLDLSVQRTTVVRESLFAGSNAGYMIDPLVLHFDGGLEKLFEQPFLFDLNGDGTPESIPGMHPGSGFLALDLDEDRVITSGRELFGPLSGSGFDDLAIHDHDDNNWIDENDPIFEKLLVWMNPSGQAQKLLSLREAGVGAISLANAGTLFNLKSPNNLLLGQVTASGLFITEKAEIKSLQDIHLRISNRDLKKQADDSFTFIDSVIAGHQERLSALTEKRNVNTLKEDNNEQEE